MPNDTRPILIRLRRKLDVMLVDMRRGNTVHYRDIEEMLALLDLLEGKQ